MKNAPLGSCWRYDRDDESMFYGQICTIVYSHRDALGDYDYEAWFTPMNRMFDVSDVMLVMGFECISLNEEI